MFDTTPDLTGINPNYVVSNDQYYIFTTGQRIDFKRPIYLNSLMITIPGSSGSLTQGTNWSVAETDYTTMSQLMVQQSNFSSTIITSIQIDSTVTTPFIISCNYQTVFTDVISNLLTRLSNIESKLSLSPTVSASTLSTPRLLTEDVNGTNPVNLISNEPYTINTFENISLIIPVSGSFFADSVVVSLASTNPPIVLVRGVDYIIVGLDKIRTRATSNVSGVYQSILLTRQYAGTVNVTYHAYGGGVTLLDLTTINSIVASINNYLSNNQFLTPSSLGSNVVIAEIVQRLATVESKLPDRKSVV